MLSRRKLILAAPALILTRKSFAQGAVFTGQPGVSGPFDVFLIAGQSNAVGHGDGYSAALDAPSSKIFMRNYWLQQVQIASEGIGLAGPQGSNIAGQYNSISGTGYVGFGLSFAKAYLAAGALTPGASGVLLVPAAVDNTGFSNSISAGNAVFSGGWVVPPASNVGGNLYAIAIAQANAAMAINVSNNFKGILWHNMENEMDFLSNVSSANMAANLASLATAIENMIAYFRAHITGASSSTPFIMGQATQYSIAYWNTNSSDGSTGTEVNNVYQTTVTGAVSDTAFLMGASPSLAGDAYVNPNGEDSGPVHYSAAGQRVNGLNYYNAWASV